MGKCRGGWVGVGVGRWVGVGWVSVGVGCRCRGG